MQSVSIKCVFWIFVAASCGHRDIPPGSLGSGMTTKPKASTAPTIDGGVPACVHAMRPCPPPCPDNSPNVNAFPVNGLAINGKGECSPESVQVMPGSLHSPNPKCKGDFDLTVDTNKTKLVGKNDSGTCDGQNLKGATFSVRGDTVVEFQITDVKPSLQLDDGKPGPEGYRIIRTGGSVSLCDVDTANAVRAELGITTIPKYEVAGVTGTGDANHDYVAVIPGPIYAEDISVADKTGQFYNLACADDALAKRSFDGLYNQGSADSDDYNIAALRMMTATYCGKHYTVHGMTFHWKERIMNVSNHPEARWLPGEVSCLETPRLTTLKKKGIQPKDLPDELLPDGCKPASDDKASSKTRPHSSCSWDRWVTEVQKECVGAGSGSAFKTCKSQDYDYESFPGDTDSTYRKKKKDDHGSPSP